MEKLDWEIFTGLLKNLICETGSETDVIGFRAKYKGHELSFHGCEEDGYDVMVEDCGRMLNGKWVQIEANEAQIGVMKIQLESRKAEISIEIIKELNKQSDAINREIEIARYGREGAIYSSDY